MISALALSVLGAWSYAGFLAEPIPAPEPAPTPTVAPAPIPLEPEKPSKPAEPHPHDSPATPNDPTKQPPALPPPTVPRPTLYRLSDASGQTWEHSDPGYLSSFVEARNQWLASAFPVTTYNYTYASPKPRRAWRFARNRS